MESVDTLSRCLSRGCINIDEMVSNRLNQYHSVQKQESRMTQRFPESFSSLSSTSQTNFCQLDRVEPPREASRGPESLQNASPGSNSEDIHMSDERPRPSQTRCKHKSKSRSAEHHEQPTSVEHTHDKNPNPISFEANVIGLGSTSSCKVPLFAQIPRILPDPIEPTKWNTIDCMCQEGLSHNGPWMLKRSLQGRYQYPETTQYQRPNFQGQPRGQYKYGSVNPPESVIHSMMYVLNHSQEHGGRDSDRSSPSPPFQRRSTSTKEKDQESSTSKETHSFASDTQDLQGIHGLRLALLTISDDVMSERASKSEAANAHDTDDMVSPSRPQSPGSSICLEEAFPDLSNPPPYLETARRRQLFIQQLMTSVTTLFRTNPIPPNEVARETAHASSNQTYSNATPSRTGNRFTQPGYSTGQPIPRKKRKLSQHSNGGDSDDEGQLQPGTPTDKQEEDGQMFGCPYHKHDMSRSGQTTGCNGGCWPSVARVKAHVYAKHKQAIHCPRCRIIFEDKATLNTHLQQRMPCDPSGEANIEGFNDDQEGQLRSRKGLSKMTEYDKWRKMYKILFHHVAETEIPSPYCDPKDACKSPTNTSKASLKACARRHSRQIANALTKKLRTRHPECDHSHVMEQDVTEALEEVLSTSPPNTHSIRRTSDIFGVEIEDLSVLVDSQAETFVLGSTSDMDPFANQGEALYSWGPEIHERPMSFSDINVFSSSSVGGSRMDYVAESAHLRQRSSATKHTSDSGYGSKEDQQSQTLPWEDIEYR